MLDGSSGSALGSRGFQRIGSLAFRIRLDVWWHADARLQVVLLPVHTTTLVKGTKAYYLEAISEEGETWARDIGPLHDWLESHFPEVHISFSHFRDITRTLAKQHVHHKHTIETPTATLPSGADIARLQRQLEQTRAQLRSSQDFLALSPERSTDLAQTYLRRHARGLRQEARGLEEAVAKSRERTHLYNHLLREYAAKGSAACFVFSLHSNVQAATTTEEFGDALDSIVKELLDAHRYQVTQKLQGGRLNIHVTEAEEPALVWLEEWLGGALSPRQVARLRPAFQELTDHAERHLMVTPDDDIRVSGSVREAQKLLGARVISTFTRRLDRPNRTSAFLNDLEEHVLPARIGLVVANNQTTRDQARLPLARLGHTYCSGKTGSGKSFCARVLIEEAAQYNDLSILILDPRNQTLGLRAQEDRETILSLYADFGMRSNEARGFSFRYYAPGLPIGKPLPSDLGNLGAGRHIVSFKGLEDEERCRLFAQILDAVFDAHADEESESVRLMVVIEEAQRFTKKRVQPRAKEAGQLAENALDRTVREGRKYGCSCVIVSQTIRDFAYDSSSIRQNTTTKIFLHNSDREVEYAADFIGDGRQIVHLPPGTAIAHNPLWGTITVKVRPPFSKVWEFSTNDAQRLLSGEAAQTSALSEAAQELLQLVREHSDDHGTTLHVSRAGAELGISSKRKLHALVDELERAGLVRTRKLQERGQPRVIDLVSPGSADKTRTQPGHNPDETP